MNTTIPSTKPTTGAIALASQPVNLALASITKQFGAGSVFRLGGNERVEVTVLSTGCPSIDLALGAGGLPRGRIVEIYGPESSGKTTFCLSVIAEAQRRGGLAAFIDVEHALDPKYARVVGVNIDDLYVSQPDNGEDALNIVETLVRSGGFEVIIVDSVAALITKSELDGEMGTAAMGSTARLMSQAMRRLTAVVSKTNTIVIFTNQIREKIGVMFGSPETTSGGRALKFFSSIRIDIRRKDQLKKPDGTVYGNLTKIKIVKNKIAAPFTECEFEILYNEGISRFASILDLALEQKFMEKKGAWISYKGDLIGQGREAAVQYLRDHHEMAEAILSEIVAKNKTSARVLPANEPADEAASGDTEEIGVGSDGAALAPA